MAFERNEPIDPTIQQTQKFTNQMQNNVAKEILQQQLEESKKYEETILKRINSSLSLEDIFLKATQRFNDPLPDPKYKTTNVYYGAMSSMNNGIDIVAVGVTADEAIKHYTEYLQEHGLSAPFKLYPISYTLYTAICSQTKYKRELGLSPKSCLVDTTLTDPDTGLPLYMDSTVVDGMVDLVRRKYSYPSTNAYTEFMLNILTTFLTQQSEYEKPNGIYKVDMWFTISRAKTLLGIEFTYDTIANKIVKINYKDANINETDLITLDDILFKYYHGHCTSIFNQMDTSITKMSFNDLLIARHNKQILQLDVEIFDSESGELADQVANFIINFIVPHGDMPIKLDIVTNYTYL